MKLKNIKLENIRTNVNQPRKNFNDEKMAELQKSIQNNGLIQPIIVREIKNKKIFSKKENEENKEKLKKKKSNEKIYEIIAGERRFRACKNLGMKEIQAIEVQVKDSTSYELSVLENIQRENLNPIEEAKSYVMLLEVYGYTPEKLAEKFGKTRSSIANKIRLLKLPERVQKMVINKEITYGHARAILGINDYSEMENLAKKIIEKRYTVRDVEKIVKNYSEKGKTTNNKVHKEKTKSEVDNNSKDSSEKFFLEDKLRKYFETKVQIIGNLDEKGKISLEFSDYEELGRILELMGVEFE